ncbi:hypothetical protein L596_023996 [Steinernema carpocapsae]|uniref:RING-type domain-containing protein n=1 Tax=Steinernema carpocapsae TaxID=34508 RepID=A0A4U5MFE7_STECR|nr:hypothetical protein L596_023996 [Steinernema carpocapsae]
MELATCPVCIDLMAKPCVLGCGHSFCELCAHEIVNLNDKCSVCRRNARGVCAPNLELEKLIEALILPLMDEERREKYERRCDEQKRKILRKNKLRCVIWSEVERRLPRNPLLLDVINRCKEVCGNSEDVIQEIREIFAREIFDNDLSVFSVSGDEQDDGPTLAFKEAFAGL